MIRVNGVDHLTLVDAAKRLGVSSKAVNEYIKQGFLPEPPRVRQGRRSFYSFSDEYLRDAKRRMEE